MSGEVLRRAAEDIRSDAQTRGEERPFLDAVADWLEVVAAWQEEGLGYLPGITATNYPDAIGEQVDAAMVAARAYLGGPNA